jgi:hypothetical protein
MFREILLIGTLLTFLLLNIADAQEQRFKAGVILAAKLGFSGGLRGVVIITDKIELSMELLFDQRGSRSQKIFDETYFPFKITNNYVSVPIVFNYQDWLDKSEEYYKLHFHAGFSYGRLISSTVKDEDVAGFFGPLRDDFRTDDISLLIGTTFYTGKHLAVTGRFSRSITPLYKNGDGPVLVRIPLISKFLTLQLLYMF